MEVFLHSIAHNRLIHVVVVVVVQVDPPVVIIITFRPLGRRRRDVIDRTIHLDTDYDPTDFDYGESSRDLVRNFSWPTGDWTVIRHMYNWCYTGPCSLHRDILFNVFIWHIVSY